MTHGRAVYHPCHVPSVFHIYAFECMYACICVYSYTDGREALKKDRAEKLAAQEREKTANDERARKMEEELSAKALQDLSMAQAAQLQVQGSGFRLRGSKSGPTALQPYSMRQSFRV
jgi:hypothetical protein